MNLVTGNNAGVQNRRRVVVGIAAVEQRVAHDGQAQIAVYIALPHTFVDGVLQQTTGNMHVLTNLYENNRHAAVLTNRHGILTGNITVFDHLTKNCLAERRLFVLLSVHIRLSDALRQDIICLHAQLAHERGNFFCFDGSHSV